ncbi:MAG: hypothetical protein CFH41_02719 [Alphaproteobacteria bacterium MarineAlpha11_Bin1]|nr:MAG: hypothetical protein CFH41_02719 [Alphaproteobacteria bacterium MarineAlpha11_Bin1]
MAEAMCGEGPMPGSETQTNKIAASALLFDLNIVKTSFSIPRWSP